MKNTKRSLMSSVVALLLCFAMLLSTTYAWFTDSAISESNIIQSGNLDVEMYWSETLLATDSNEWKNADGVPIFTYDNWEPGYTDVKYVKVKNAGNLSLQWRLNIEAEGEVTELADVIDVYYINPVSETVTTLSDKTSVGVLSNVIDAHTYTSGVLLPTGEVSTEYIVGETILAIAFHMQEDAGNAYQGKSIGDGFSVSLIATQFSYESDSFDKDYDNDASWPNNVIVGGNSATATVVPDANNKVSSAVSLLSNDGKINANVPMGVKLEQGVDKLTLNVSDVANSQANISLSQTEAALSIDVHINGVAEDNDVVMAIGLKELLPVGLNMGNYRFYHVENGATVEMMLLADGATPVHNNYEYDPANGDVVLYLKSFSEVALVADNVNSWEGKFDYTWYDASKTELTIANADQLAAFGAIVGGMNGQTKDNFAGKTVKLLADVNLGDKESENNPDLIFYPIGYYNSTGSYEKTSGGSVTSSVSSFEGTFDGNGNTIENFYQNTWEMFGDYNDGYSGTPNHYKDAMGLFGYVLNGTVKNLTVSNFSSDGEYTPTGVIAAYADGNSIFENIAITNCNPRVYNTGNGGIVGIAGDTSAANDDHITLKNITVDNSNKISALWGSWDVACGGLVGMYRGNVDGNGNATGDTISFENCHVSAIIDVYNDVCANYQYYAYRYSGMIIGSVRHNTKNAEGKTIPDMTGISATGCTVNYGDWNDYYYCEFEKNTMASYSEDYQFSRVPHSELNFTDSNGNGVVDADERASVTGCTHTHTAEENHQAIYLPFHQLFTGYSWGVSSIGLKEYSGIVTNLDITEGEQEESVKKFEKADNAPETYRPGQTINVGDLFKEIAGIKVPVVSSSVYVSVSPVTENDKGSAIYSADTNDWSNGTITFADDCVGALKIVITDYFFCTKTVIVLNAETAQKKFTAKMVDAQNAYTQINLGNLFTASGIKQDVTATVLVDGNAFATINGTAADWASKTIDLTKDGKYTVTIKENDDYCEATTVEFTVNKVDKFESKFTGDFLYRVGNKNTVALGSLFNEIKTAVGLSSVNVTFITVAGNANGTFTANATWTSGKIQFTDTGVVKVTISADGANSVELMLEVVEATNYASSTISSLGSGNVALLCDTKLNNNGALALQNASLYGNGFTIDVTAGKTTGESITANYLLYMNDATIDNVQVVGAVYTNFDVISSNSWNNPVILSVGNSTIANSYISNCASPVRLRSGNLNIINSTLKGGFFANLDIRGGDVVLDNVTTINQANLNDKSADGKEIVGLGVVVYYEGPSADTTITIKNNLTQYNYLENKQTSNSYANMLIDEIFGNASKYQAALFTDANGIQWANTGVVSLSEEFGKNVFASEQSNSANFTGIGLSYTHPQLGNVEGYLYVSNPKVLYDSYTYIPNAQYEIVPKVSFDHKINEVVKTDDSETTCTSDPLTDSESIAFADGDSFEWNVNILKSSNKDITYTVWVDGVQYTDKIVFSESGTHTVVFKYSDANNYRRSGDTVEKYTVEYQIPMDVIVTEKEAAAKSAEITFPLLESYGTTKVTVDGKTYIMPNLTGTNIPKYGDDLTFDASTRKYGSLKSDSRSTVDIYYPIIKTAISGNYMVYPVFGNKNGTLVQIQDYADNGAGAALTPYNASTQTMPAGLSVVRGYTVQWSTKAEEVGSGSMSYGSWTGGLLCMKYQSSSDDIACKVMSNYLSYYPNINLRSNDRNEQVTVVEYKYVDNKGDTYYYCVGYHIEERNNGYAFSETVPESSGGCVTPDTLITLANGTQIRVDSLTGNEELLVWNMETGMLDKAPIMFVDSDAEAEYEIIKLKFSDGTEVKIIYEHGFWDYDLNKYVYLDRNAADYIGHTFAKQNGDALEKVQLVDVVIETETTTAWSPVTAGHLCYFVNGMLSMPGGVGGLFNIFEVDAETMTYDYEQMAKDIETYGLYTYEELNAICPLSEDMFNAAGGAYLKISIGKGNLTEEELFTMINRYSKFFN